MKLLIIIIIIINIMKYMNGIICVNMWKEQCIISPKMDTYNKIQINNLLANNFNQQDVTNI